MKMQKEKKRDKPISFKVRSSTYQELYKIAYKEDRSVSYVIEKLLRKALNLKD